MATLLETTLHELSAPQRKAVEWDDGALLVLAGPDSGKARVLACRIARLLDRSRDERFRILALTFTNKAAHDMSSRVTVLAPGLEERADILAFHGFCARVLRQHGVHLGIKPDFAIYSRMSDRLAALEDAVRRDTRRFDPEDRRLLAMIDAMKAQLVDLEQAEKWVLENSNASPEEARRAASVYGLYEEELRRANALDFNSLVFEAYRLFRNPAMARHYRTVYRYWIVDEFQDADAAQCALLRRMATDRRLFAVADDDRIICARNGANPRRIRDLVNDFGCEVVQLTDNARCPPSVVEAANRLAVYDVRRNRPKSRAVPAAQRTEGHGIECRAFADDGEEASRIAAEVAALGTGEREETVVLAPSRALLEPVRAALTDLNVSAAVLGRRDDFASPQMRWLVACLKQINRPLDRRNMVALTGAFAGFAGVSPTVSEVVVRSETGQVTLLAAWIDAARRAEPSALPLVEAVASLASGSTRLAEAAARGRGALRMRGCARRSERRHQRVAPDRERDTARPERRAARPVPPGDGIAFQGAGSGAGRGFPVYGSWGKGSGVRQGLSDRPRGSGLPLAAQHRERQWRRGR